jgi:hypothetical protein
MTAPARTRIKYPIKTVLYDLECLHEDIQFMLGNTQAKQLDDDVVCFIKCIRSAMDKNEKENSNANQS